MDHRSLVPMEMFSVERRNLNFYKCVSTYLRFEVTKFSLAEWQPRIEQSLRYTIDVQQRLRLQVDISRSPAHFLILPMSSFDTLPIRIVEQTENDQDEDEFLLNILENETNTEFNYDQISPLWRVILVFSSFSPIFTLIVSYDHSIGDGISGMAFLTTFVECVSKSPSTTFSLADDRSMDDACPSSLPPLRTLASELVENLLLPRFLCRYFFPKTYWTGNVVLPGNESNRTRMLAIKLAKPFIDLFHAKCKLEQTTVHSAVCASLLLAVVRVFSGEQANMELTCGTAINLRPYCEPVLSNCQIGVYLSTVDTHHCIPTSSNFREQFWPLARQLKEQLTLGIRKEGLSLIQIMKFVKNWNQFLLDQRKTLPNGCRDSVDVSNLLRWSLETEEKSLWQVVDGGFTQSSNIVGSVFTISVVTINDTFTVHITFQEAAVPDFEQAKQLRDTMKQFLIEMIE